MRCQTLWEARWILLVLAALTAGAWFVTPWLAIAPVAMLVFTFSFFRDPQRVIPGGEGDVVSPADGKVTDIVELEEDEVTKTRMRRVGIFLSVFDVHVNRMPLAGTITYSANRNGSYHDARSPLASTHNTARTWGLDCGGQTLVVRQITGAIARRIVPWAKVGDQLGRGQHFGMIRFGSRTEIYLPTSWPLCVAVGEHVRGGATIIARTGTAGQSAREDQA